MKSLLKKRSLKGQIMTEFTFSMIMALVMIFSLIMIFRWTGFDYAWRRVDHDQRLMMPVTEDYIVECSGLNPNQAPCKLDQGPIEQIDPYFHKPAKMESAWGL